MKVLLILILLATCFLGYTQEVVSSAGETIKNSNYEISYTIGEPVIETIIGGDNVLTQGMHQSKLTITSITELLCPELQVKVFPNPTQDQVTIKFADLIENLSYSIFDMSGKLIKTNQIQFIETSIDLNNYVRGSYVLKLCNSEQKLIQSFKIIKE